MKNLIENLLHASDEANIELVKANILANGLKEKLCNAISEFIFEKYKETNINREGQDFELYSVSCFLELISTESKSADMTIFFNFITDKDIIELNEEMYKEYAQAKSILQITKKWPTENNFNLWRSELYYCTYSEIINQTVSFDIDEFSADELFVIK